MSTQLLVDLLKKIDGQDESSQSAKQLRCVIYARNMKDGGEIIDLIDKNIIKDLKFKTFAFERSTTGKMMLGFAFVLSKQYSDQLSSNVKRGNRMRTREGKLLGRFKHGYYKDPNDFLRPDGENFMIIKQAFKLRIEGKTLEEIADFLNENHYKKYTKGGRELQVMNKKRVSDFLRDPVHAGVLVYGDEIVDLTEIYDFTLMVTVEEFLKINKTDTIARKLKMRDRKQPKDTERNNLLSGKVICGHCGKAMHISVTSKKMSDGSKKLYFSYKCDENKVHKYKGVRANVIVDFALAYLEENLFNTEAVYKHYEKEMKRVSADEKKNLQNRKKSIQKQHEAIHKSLEEIMAYLPKIDDVHVEELYKADIKQKREQLETLEAELSEVKKQITEIDDVSVNHSKFLELFSNLPLLLRKTSDMATLDFLLGKIFSNFTVEDKKVTAFSLNTPFKEFVEQGEHQKVLNGRDYRAIHSLCECFTLRTFGKMRASSILSLT